MQDKITIADAPDCLNTNDKAMWVLGYQAAIEARSTCLLQIQEPPTKTETLAHYSQQAILAMDEAAPAAVAVPTKLPTGDEIRAIARSVSTSSSDSPSPSEYVMAGYRAALAATTAADAPLNAEMLAALQSVGMDAVGVGGGENTISDSARAKVEAVLEKIGAPWPSSDTAAAAPVVLPEPVGWIDKSALEWIGSRDRGTDAYSTAYLHKSQCAEAGEPIYTEQQMRALLAGVSAPAAQAVWDGKLPESLQRALNELRIDCKTDAISSLEFEVRSVFEGMHTSLTTVKRMYHAAQKRLDSTDAAQPDPFAAPQAQADARDAALLDFIESHAEGVIRLDAVPNYLYWGKHWEHKTARAAIAAAKGE